VTRPAAAAATLVAVLAALGPALRSVGRPDWASARTGASGSVDGTVVRRGAIQAPSSPLNILSARFGQLDQDLVLSLRTSGRWRTSQLAAAGGRSLCLRILTHPAPGPGLELCVVPAGGGAQAATARLDARGRPGRLRPLPTATVRRSDARSLTLRVAAGDLGLAPGLLRWQLSTNWSRAGCGARSAGTCADLLPAAGVAFARLLAVRPVGCDSGRGGQFTNGSRRSRMVGLSFDDGPSTYTPRYLDVLEREGVRATFFQIGEQVAGTGALESRILRDGDEIGDHTFNHPDVSGGGAFAQDQLAQTRAVIQRTSGYQPCLFRPPYGTTSPALVSVARGLGLATIIWDVDPRDWSRPGTDAIYSRVTGMAQRGSVILMHDGGGPRDQTLAALPRIIDTLKARGYQLVPVSVLLGFPTRYGRR